MKKESEIQNKRKRLKIFFKKDEMFCFVLFLFVCLVFFKSEFEDNKIRSVALFVEQQQSFNVDSDYAASPNFFAHPVQHCCHTG